MLIPPALVFFLGLMFGTIHSMKRNSSFLEGSGIVILYIIALAFMNGFVYTLLGFSYIL